jgi:hypothetical protein
MRDSQIIKTSLLYDDVVSIIKDICIYDDKQNIYIFNKTAYKRMKYYKKDTGILKKLGKHYYESKLFYIKRKMSYKTFTTIIRQICKYAQLRVMSEIKYEKSSYIIEYYITLPDVITE